MEKGGVGPHAMLLDTGKAGSGLEASTTGSPDASEGTGSGAARGAAPPRGGSLPAAPSATFSTDAPERGGGAPSSSWPAPVEEIASTTLRTREQGGSWLVRSLPDCLVGTNKQNRTPRPLPPRHELGMRPPRGSAWCRREPG